jgi:uncharacterized membrane protein YozB (DUF420 family)
VFTGPNIILTLKIAVAAVSFILAASLVCLITGNYRWHGRLNIVFFVLTMSAVLGLEAIIRFIDPSIFDYFTEEDRRHMNIHLAFSIPSTILLPLMLVTGWRNRRKWHVPLGLFFLAVWLGTAYTGIFLLRHST